MSNSSSPVSEKTCKNTASADSLLVQIRVISGKTELTVVSELKEGHRFLTYDMKANTDPNNMTVL